MLTKKHVQEHTHACAGTHIQTHSSEQGQTEEQIWSRKEEQFRNGTDGTEVTSAVSAISPKPRKNWKEKNVKSISDKWIVVLLLSNTKLPFLAFICFSTYTAAIV